MREKLCSELTTANKQNGRACFEVLKRTKIGESDFVTFDGMKELEKAKNLLPNIPSCQRSWEKKLKMLTVNNEEDCALVPKKWQAECIERAYDKLKWEAGGAEYLTGTIFVTLSLLSLF